MTSYDDLDRVLDRLDEEEIPYVVVGAVALDALGTPRRTGDIDLLLAADPPETTASTYLGLLVQERSRDEVFDQVVVAGHLPTRPTPFEMFFADHPFTREAVDRGTLVDAEAFPRPLRIPTVEDFLVMKAAYSAHASRSRRKAAQDAVDLETVVETQGKAIDWGQVEEGARDLGCWDELADLDPR